MSKDCLTVFVHGTNPSLEKSDLDFIKSVGNTFNEEVNTLRWSCKQKWREWKRQFAEGRKLNVGYSYGGSLLKFMM